MKSARMDLPEIIAILQLCQSQQGDIVESQYEWIAEGRASNHMGTWFKYHMGENSWQYHNNIKNVYK